MNNLPLDGCAIVIFGASGDLTKRKLLPALSNLHARRLLPEHFAVLGIGRTKLSDEEFRSRAMDHDSGADETFRRTIFYRQLDTRNVDAYGDLAERLASLDESHGTRGNYLFYLSTPPSAFETIVRGIAKAGLHEESDERSWRRLVVEKPFGYDLASAEELEKQLHKAFSERQIYRIDHYLGKETVQNMLVLRFGNGIFEPLWNRNYVQHVEITAAESIGVEDRGGYYERSGALRDMFQNHLLHVAGMIAMEPPASFNAASVRNETMKVFESLRPLSVDDVRANVIRGQYVSSTIGGRYVPGYREEKGVAPDSRTETYVAARFYIDNWRWSDVPFLVRTGKRLPTRVTEAVIHFKQAPHRLFAYGASARRDGDECGCNQLIMRIQPDEGILINFNMKLPGGGFEMKTVSMDFHYSDLSDLYTPEAYERLLIDAVVGDATLFTRHDAVEACWRFVDPILNAWREEPDIPLHGYPAGSWGPEAARTLLQSHVPDWRRPCRNLAENGEFCDL